jgi:formate hydrogenlyase subunit 3/multisubunit Na+/H+ antiporter MnhD subunit
MSHHDPVAEAERTSATASRLFDLRMIIAVLFVIYGTVLVIMGFTSTSDEDIARAGDMNLNLWAGVGMLVTAALFGLWVWLRPLKLPTPEEIEAAPAPPPGH